MSSDRPAKKPKRPELPRLESKPHETAATLGVVRRISGRVPDGLSNADRPSHTDSPPTVDGPPVSDSLSVGQPVPRPTDSPPSADRPPAVDGPPTSDRPKGVNLIASLPPAGGATHLPHRYDDHLCRLLTADEQAVYVQLYRLSWGWGKETCFISNPKLSERSNVRLTSARRAVSGLVGKGLIAKTGRTFGSGQTEQGVEYRVFRLDGLSNTDSPPRADSLSNVATNKERIKETDQSVALACPDCYGTGWFYPRGTSAGVQRCRHERLKGK